MKIRKKNSNEEWKKISLEKIMATLKSIISDEELHLYKNLGKGLYELPGNIICNKKGLDEYLKKLNRE